MYGLALNVVVLATTLLPSSPLLPGRTQALLEGEDEQSSDFPLDTPYDRGRFTLNVANDDFGSDVDEAFTSGIEAVFRFAPGEGFAVSSQHSWLAARRIREYWSVVLGHEIYTPALLQETNLEILSRDRRYAGWVYGGLRTELALAHSPFIANGHSFYRVQLSLGSTGPRTQTEALQRYWHAFIRDALNRRRLPEDPKGWAIYQVPNHWGVNIDVSQEAEFLRLESRNRWLKRHFGADLAFRAASLAQVRLGNMWVDASVGAVFRAGILPQVTFEDMTLPVLFEGKRLSVPIAVYGFVSGRIIGSLYNALLDGPPGAEGPYPDRKNGLVRLEAGFAVRAANIEFMFRHTTLSPELRNPPPGGVWIQNWGRITLSFAFY